MPEPRTLPRPAASFVGRAQELDELRIRIDGEQRLVTLVGPGGVGKTRLALEVASAWEKRARRPAVFVDLAGARDEADVLASALAAFGLRGLDRLDVEAGLARLAKACARGRSLTVLDNAEQVVDAVARLVVAMRAEGASIVVTSRQPLEVAGENRFPVEPLPEPDAVQLFATRARQVAPLAEGSPGDDAAMAEIVAAVGRLPLAIELAAARASIMTPAEIVGHLSRSLAFLRGGPRDAPSRHSSLHAAIAWSFELLDATERRALVGCATFHDGFTANAAEQVLAAADDARPVLDVLQSLRDKSLLRAESDPRAPAETRYRMYEGVRSFAVERLASDPRREELVARHAHYFEALVTSEGARARARAGAPDGAAEMANVLEAARRGSAETCARIAVAIAAVLASSHPLETRLALLDRAVLAAEQTGDGALLARVLVARGEALVLAARLDAAALDAERARAQALMLGLRQEEGAAEVLLARVAVDRVDLARAREHASRAVERLEGPGLAGALQALGYVETQVGELDAADRTLGMALSACYANHERLVEPSILMAMAEAAQGRGLPVEAADLHARAGAVARETGHRSLEALAAANLAYALCELADYDRVAHHSQEALAIARELGDHRIEVLALSSLAFARQAQGRLDEALACTTRGLGLPAGELAGVIVRICHAAVLGERGALAESRAIFGSLDAASARFPTHPLRDVLTPASLFVDLGAALARAREGDLAAALRTLAPVQEAVLRERASRTLARPDVRLWWVFLSHALERHALLFGAATCRVEIAADGAWFRRDDRDPVACGQRPVLRKLLVALARARLELPGKAVPVPALVAALWPDEKMREASARRRLQVAVSRLRELGLGGVVENDDDGYLLVSAADVRVSAM